MKREYTLHVNDEHRYTEWEVFCGDTWIASFARKTDAEIFIKIKQIETILTA